MNQQRNQYSVDIKMIEKVVSQIFPAAQTQVERIMEGISTNVYRLPYRLEPFLVRGYREITVLPAGYEQHIRFISILTTVRILASVLQKHPPNRFTQHQLSVLQEDLAAEQ